MCADTTKSRFKVDSSDNFVSFSRQFSIQKRQLKLMLSQS